MNGQTPNDQTNNPSTGLNGNVLGNVTGGLNNQTISQENTMLNGTQMNLANNVTPNVNPQGLGNQQPETLETGNVNFNLGNPSQEVGTQENLSEQPPIMQPIPGTEGTASANNSGIMGSIPLSNQNTNMIEPQKNESIGSIPPKKEKNENGKKPMNKVLFIILILALIALVAFGVYYFLSVSKNSVKLSVKNVTVGIGEPLSDKITDYAKITRGDIANCQLNTRNVNANVIGSYEFTITCGDDKYTGKINVSDITAPTVKLNIVYKPIGSTATIEDFVASCVDPSNCTTSFKDETALNNNLATAGGPYNIEINASDTAGNNKVVNGILYVTPYDILAFRKCSSPSTQVEGFQAAKVTTDILPIGNIADAGLSYLGVSRRNFTYTFTDAEEYQNTIKDKLDTMTFDGNTGSVTYDERQNAFTISVDLSQETLNTEAGGTFPTSYADFNTLYESRNYTCSNTSYYSINN